MQWSSLLLFFGLGQGQWYFSTWVGHNSQLTSPCTLVVPHAHYLLHCVIATWETRALSISHSLPPYVHMSHSTKSWYWWSTLISYIPYYSIGAPHSTRSCPKFLWVFFLFFFFWAYLAWFGSPGHHSPSLPPLGNCPSLLSSSVNIYYAPVKSKLWTYWESYWRRLSCRYLLSWKRLFRLGFMLNGPAGTPLYPAHGQLLLSRLPSGFPKIPLWSNSILQQNATLKVSYLFWSLNPQSSNSFDIFLSCSRPYRSN